MNKDNVKINLNKIVPVTYLSADTRKISSASYSLIDPHIFTFNCFAPYEDGEYEANIVWAEKNKYSGLTFDEYEAEIEFEVAAGLDFQISKVLLCSNTEYDEFMKPIYDFFGTTEIKFEELTWLKGILTLKTNIINGREKMEILKFVPVEG